MKKPFTLTRIAIGLAVLGLLVFIFYPVHSNGNWENGPRSNCQSNLKQIGLAIKQYIQDNDENFPLASSKRGDWVEVLQPYVKSQQLFRCLSDASGEVQGTTDYFYNSRLSGVPEMSLDYISYTIMNGDGVPNSPSNYSLNSLPPAWLSDTKSPAWRHLEGANYSFADGHVKWFKPDKITTTRTPDTSSYSFAVK